MRIPIVDENDEIIKNIDIDERMPGEICRVSALWVTNEKDEVLLAQRAFTKRRDPGAWGPAVAGTVEEGETYEQNIIKEAGEEIGLFNFKPVLSYKNRNSSSHEYFGQWFTTVINSSYPLKKQDSEVEQLKWFKKEDIIRIYNENPDTFVPTFKRTMDRFIINENKS